MGKISCFLKLSIYCAVDYFSCVMFSATAGSRFYTLAPGLRSVLSRDRVRWPGHVVGSISARLAECIIAEAFVHTTI